MFIKKCKYQHQAVILLFCLLVVGCSKSQIEPDLPLDDISICEQLNSLKMNVLFNERLMDLYNSSLIHNYEEGLLMYNTQGNHYNYETIKGNTNQPSLNITLSKKIDGILHSHYKNLYPMFSIGDMRALSEVVKGNYINNYNTFNFGLVCSGGELYLLKFDDRNKALSFFNKNFGNSDRLIELETKYLENRNFLLKSKTKQEACELAFLKILENSGLILIRANSKKSEWFRIESSTFEKVIEKPCK